MGIRQQRCGGDQMAIMVAHADRLGLWWRKNRQSASIRFQCASVDSARPASASPTPKSTTASWSVPAIAHLVFGGLAEARHGAGDPVRGPGDQSVGIDDRQAEQFGRLRGVGEPRRSAAPVPVMMGSRPSSAPNLAARSRTARISWPLTLIGEVGVSQCARQRNACDEASPCQMKLTWPRLMLIGWRVENPGGDVVQHAVAHVDRVIEPEQAAGRLKFTRKIFEHPAHARRRIARIRRADWGRGLRSAPLPFDRHERIDATGRKRHDPRSRERLARPGQEHGRSSPRSATGHPPRRTFSRP